MLKKIAMVVVAASILLQSSVAYANTTFTDLQGYDWAVPAIEAMANKGVITGVGGNNFAPKSNVTKIEFTSMAIRAVGGDIDELAQKAGNLAEIEAENGNYWGNSVIAAGQILGLSHFCTDKEGWETPATRGEMAYIAITMAEMLGQEKFEHISGINANIYDFNAVRSCSAAIPANYFGAILKAYGAGIVSGVDAKGRFAPENNATRAEAAVMIWRLIEPSQRVEVKLIEPIKTSPSATGDNVVDGVIYPKEGDIGRDGKPITRDPETGVLGYGNGQKGGIYLGITSPINGNRIDVNSSAWDSYDNMWGDYSRRKDYVYWAKEWNIIDNYVLRKLKEEYPPNEYPLGLQADIEGNIIQPGSDAIPMYKIIYFAGVNMWNPSK